MPTIRVAEHCRRARSCKRCVAVAMPHMRCNKFRPTRSRLSSLFSPPSARSQYIASLEYVAVFFFQRHRHAAVAATGTHILPVPPPRPVHAPPLEPRPSAPDPQRCHGHIARRRSGFSKASNMQRKRAGMPDFPVSILRREIKPSPRAAAVPRAWRIAAMLHEGVTLILSIESRHPRRGALCKNKPLERSAHAITRCASRNPAAAPNPARRPRR